MEEIYKKIEEGKKLFSEEKYEEALTLFKQVLEKNDTSSEVYFEIGKIYFIIGQIENAKIYLEKVIDLDFKQIYAYDLLMKVYNQKNDYNSFEKMFEKVYSFFDREKYYDNIEMIIILFNIARYINRYNQIIKVSKSNIKYIKACSIQQKKQLLLALSDIYYRNNKKKKSIIYKYKYLQNNLEDINVLISLVKEYIELKKIKKAYKVLKKSLNIEKNRFNYDIWKHIIMVIEQISKKEMIKNDLETLFKIIPDNFIKFKNIILNELEIINNEINLKSKPRTLVVTLTSSCDIKCIMCRAHKHPWQLPEKTKQEIIELMPYLESVVWLGGEVFLYKYFEELFEKASECDVSQNIITNAMSLNESKIIKILKSNVNLVISVDGVTKEVYEHIRVGASFDKLIENLELIKFYRKKFNCQNTYRMNSLILKSNYKQIEQFVDFANKYGFTNLFINGISSDFFSEENIFYYYRDDNAIDYLASMREKIRKKAYDYKIELHNSVPTKQFLELIDSKSFSFTEENINLNWINNIDFSSTYRYTNNKFCLVPWKKLMIDRDGYVRPDCFCTDEKPIGNILKDSLIDIWNSKYMSLYRKFCMIEPNLNIICEKDCLDGRIEDVYRK